MLAAHRQQDELLGSQWKNIIQKTENLVYHKFHFILWISLIMARIMPTYTHILLFTHERRAQILVKVLNQISVFIRILNFNFISLDHFLILTLITGIWNYWSNFKMEMFSLFKTLLLGWEKSLTIVVVLHSPQRVDPTQFRCRTLEAS